MLIRKNTEIATSSGVLSKVLVDLFSFITDDIRAQMYIFNGRILVDGEECYDDIEIKEHQEITFLTPRSLEPVVATDYVIVFEDADLLVIDKPSPLPVHAGGSYYFNTLLFLLKDNYDSLYPVHRLDRETSGLLVLAKNKETAQHFQREFEANRIKKKYYALTFNQPKELNGTITAPLKPGQFYDIRDHMLVSDEGKSCVTHYKTLTTSKKYSLLEIDLESGRRHQIRAHLAHINCPIVGDKQYAGYPDLFVDFTKGKTSTEEIIEKVESPVQLLHCFYLEFIHPKTNKLVEFKILPRRLFLDFMKKAHLEFNF